MRERREEERKEIKTEDRGIKTDKAAQLVTVERKTRRRRSE